MFGEKKHKNFSGKFGKIRAKILRTPKNLLAPTPMLENSGRSQMRFGERLDCWRFVDLEVGTNFYLKII